MVTKALGGGVGAYGMGHSYDNNDTGWGGNDGSFDDDK